MLFILRKTAAVYIRTMPQGDGELYRKGLLRNATKSKRGIFIGRHARQNLFDLFMDDKVSAKDAEVICQLTQNLTDEARVEEIQSRAAGLLRDGKSWEYIGGMTQLLANKERVTMRQGLLDLGADFEADLDKMARCIEANMQALKNAIKLLKMGKRLSKDNRAEAERLGVIATTSEDSEGKLAALQGELTRWEYIGSYPDLIAGVQMWDGETRPDPVRRVLEEYERGREGAEGGEDLRFTIYDLRFGSEAPTAREGRGAGAPMYDVGGTMYDLGNSAAAPRGELPGELFGNSEQVGGAGELDFSSNMEEGEKRYRVENDTTGLEKYLNDKVKPIEINFTPKKAPDSGETWLDDFKEFYSKVLAGKELVIRRTGNKLYFHDSSDVKSTASKGVRNQTKNEAGKKMEEVVVEAYHLQQSTPVHKENEGKHRRKMVDMSDEFHVFGHPITVNGEKMMMWFAAVHRKDEADPKRLRFYEFGTPKVIQKGMETPPVEDLKSYLAVSPSEDTLADYLKNVNSDFEGKPEIVEEKLSDGGDLTIFEREVAQIREGAQAEGHDGVIVKNVYDPGNYPDAVLPGMSIGVFSPGQIKSVDNRGTFDAGNADISFSVAEAKERGLFKDGVMELGNGVQDFSGYVDHVDVNQRVWDIMRGRNGEAEGEKVAEEWGRLAQVVSLKIAAGGSGGDDKLRITNYELRIGNSAPTAREGEGMLSGAEMIGRMMALIAATRKVLPDRWGNARGVGQMLAWAKWYAQMAESGQVVRTDTLRGAVYEKALAAMKGADERRRNSYTEAEAEAWLKRHAGERLDGMLLNLAKRMRRQIEQYVKENMREDMLETVQALYPKMEPGTYIKRGKATTATYRYAEYVKKALMMRGDWLVNDPVHQEAVGRLERKLRRSDLTEEERAKYERALEELREEEVNSLSEEIERQQDILDDPNKSEEAKEAAREYLHALRTFGGWRYKDFSECQQAYARFEEVIIRGRRIWQEQEAGRRRKMGYIKKRVRQTQDRHKRSAWATDG